MKFVIIGGGIAGLAQARLLLNEGYDVMVCEKLPNYTKSGHAILMNQAGIDILNSMKPTCDLAYHPLNQFNLYNELGHEEYSTELNGWNCIKRSAFIQYLHDLIPPSKLAFNKSFSHFLIEQNNIKAAVFLDGTIVYGDVFIGADGSNSAVRKEIAITPNFTPIEVCEIVGITKWNAKDKQNQFRKIIHSEKGLSFGCIPVSEEEAVWFIQYDVRLNHLHFFESSEKLKDFCFAKSKELNGWMNEVLSENDFNTSYIWKTRDFDILETFHFQNVVLIGDAAHLALPFTSTGTSNALIDAKTLTNCIIEFDTLNDAFENYRLKRIEMLQSHLNQGRELKRKFLSNKQNCKDCIPLAS